MSKNTIKDLPSEYAIAIMEPTACGVAVKTVKTGFKSLATIMAKIKEMENSDPKGDFRICMADKVDNIPVYHILL